MRDEDRYLMQRGKRYYYYRRVPQELDQYDARGKIRISLKTKSVESARQMRDDIERADDMFWASLVAGRPAERAKAKYDAAVQRAKAMKIRYLTADELEQRSSIEVVERIEMLDTNAANMEIDAVLGGVTKPKVTVTQAFQVYIDQIAADEVRNKSKAQRSQWEKVKRRALNNFVKLIGDIPMQDITREHAQQFYRWWLDRVVGEERLSGNAANRDVGNMRKLYREYFEYTGEEDRINPFRSLSYDDKKKNTRPPFSVDWILKSILNVGGMASLNEDARLIIYSLIETGCRPSEICNLEPSRIHLDGVPHLVIREEVGREIKTHSSERVIPLVGVSLEAIKRRPQGFAKYLDKENGFSAAAMKHFKKHGLLETKKHSIYSLRHSFEKRMVEADIDYGLRCILMGHHNDRPTYGDGGSIEYRRDQLMKFALPFDAELFES